MLTILPDFSAISVPEMPKAPARRAGSISFSLSAI
jgi:hypothetical protein